MSVDVVLKQKGLFKKKLSLDDLTMGKLSYGTYDSWILKERVCSDDMILYDPQQIGRGIGCMWHQEQPTQISFRLLLPSPRHEVELFYELIAHIANLWNLKKYEQDQEEQKVQDIPAMKENILAFSNACLKDFLKQHEEGLFFSALHPLYYDTSDMEEMKTNFGSYLHVRQSRDLYFSRCHIYEKKDRSSYFGAYTLTTGIDSIFPLVPEVPFGLKDPQTQAELLVEHWYVTLYDYEEHQVLGQIAYEDFVLASDLSTKERYDAKTRILPGVDRNTMNAWLDLYGTDIN